MGVLLVLVVEESRESASVPFSALASASMGSDRVGSWCFGLGAAKDMVLCIADGPAVASAAASAAGLICTFFSLLGGWLSRSCFCCWRKTRILLTTYSVTDTRISIPVAVSLHPTKLRERIVG